MIRFLHPEALLLALVPLALLRRRFLGPWPVTLLRSLACVLLAAVVAEPYVLDTAEGRDLVLLVDRSRSVPGTADATVAEVSERVAKEARPEDRVGVVTFGRAPVVEGTPVPSWKRSTFVREVDPDGTDLGEAIDAALSTIPPDRPGSILLLSDGEGTGADPEPAARRALRRGVRVDAVPLRRAGAADVAVEEVALPAEAAAGEPFQFTAWVRSDRPGEGTWRLLRDGAVVAEGRRAFRAGIERLTFRDRVTEAGVHAYAVEVAVPGDRVPENDRARAVLRVGGAFHVVCVTPGGREDRLTRSLLSAGLSVVVRAPESAPSTLDALEGVRAVVLEDVAAGDLPSGAIGTLARWVTDLGGGLLMTGGGASFGPGGYHASPLADVLPVSLEMREEHRKFSLAMAIVLDRSGSMSISVAGGRMRKMDLANLGACAAVELLTGMDSVSVIAVDSEPHRVVPLQPVRDRTGIAARIRSIESMGGGIFVSTGLHAAAGELRGATQGTRHVVLFADAADAEEPGDYATFVPALRAAGVTVSVIGLGSDHDSDAEFLKDVAAKGGGRVFFTADPADLPRVFAQETIQVAKSAMVEEPCAVAVLPDLVAVGALAGAAFPQVGGYTIAYRKPDAQVGLVTTDDQKAPLLSFWQRGLGRSAAFLGQADGKLSGGLSTWTGYGDFFSTLVRWASGSEASGSVFAEAVRRGHEGILTIETESGAEEALARVDARLVGPSGDVRPLDLRRIGPSRLEARFPLAAAGTHRPVVSTGDGRFLRVAPLTLPYSPEFEPLAHPGDGEETLARLARLSGGRVDPPAGTLFDGPREGRGVRWLGALTALAALLTFLLEVLVRRTQFVPHPVARAKTLWGGLRGRLRRRAPGAAKVAVPEREGAGAPPPRPAPAAAPAEAPPAAPPAPVAPPPPSGIESVLDRAKRRRGR